jgi:hypothetical protein
MNQLIPNQGDYVILTSDDWRIFDNDQWRAMTVEEQMEASK